MIRREHPDDKKARIEGQNYGRKHAPEFCDEFLREMVLLIATYADAKAHDRLDELREKFWAEEWKPSAEVPR